MTIAGEGCWKEFEINNHQSKTMKLTKIVDRVLRRIFFDVGFSSSGIDILKRVNEIFATGLFTTI